MDWTKEILTEFIEIYRSHICLWQIKSKEYTNKNLKNRAYDELVKYCKTYFSNADRAFVTKKIQNIRAAFQKEANKVSESKRSGNSAEDVYTPTLWYYDLLLFTKDQDTPLDSISNIASPNTDSNGTEQENEVDEYSEVEVVENTELVSETNGQEGFKTPTTSSASLMRTPSQKRKPNNIPTELKKFMNVCSTALTQREEVDEYMAIAVNIAAKLKKMAPNQAHLSESLINTVIQKGLFNELTRATVVTDMPNALCPNHSRAASSAGSSSSDLTDFYTNATTLYNL